MGQAYQYNDWVNIRRKAMVPPQASHWHCQTCGEGVHEVPSSYLASRYGEEYASQTNRTPCQCMQGLTDLWRQEYAEETRKSSTDS